MKSSDRIEFGYAIVYVPDVAQALAFYERAFGVQRGFEHHSGQYAELDTGHTKLAFAEETLTATCHHFEPNRLANRAAGIEVAFVVSDVASAFARAVDAGATALVAPVDKPWGQTVSYLRDLNGVLVELCSAVRHTS